MSAKFEGKDWFKALFGFYESDVLDKKHALGVGFDEVKKQFEVTADTSGRAVKIKSLVNNKLYDVGTFSTPTIAELRAECSRVGLNGGSGSSSGSHSSCSGSCGSCGGSNSSSSSVDLSSPSVFDQGSLSKISLESSSSSSSSSSSHTIRTTFEYRACGDVFLMHHANPGALFQAASQFNCLEFPSPTCTPENGVTEYYCDRTQGPACALACGAGTLYRNYFVPRDDENKKTKTCTLPDGNVVALAEEATSGGGGARRERIGQSEHDQINTLVKLEELIDNKSEDYWRIENGYTHSSEAKLSRLNAVLKSYTTEAERDRLLRTIQVGLHSDVGVTFSHRFTPVGSDAVKVSQCYCSALSCGYTGIDNRFWEPLACLVLDAMYEGAILAGGLNRHRGGSRDVFLTLIGGGVFGNDLNWIARAIARAMVCAYQLNLDINIVVCFYMSIDEAMAAQIKRDVKSRLLVLGYDVTHL